MSQLLKPLNDSSVSKKMSKKCLFRSNQTALLKKKRKVTIHPIPMGEMTRCQVIFGSLTPGEKTFMTCVSEIVNLPNTPTTDVFMSEAAGKNAGLKSSGRKEKKKKNNCKTKCT